jgi:hypothetical protein
MSQLLVGLSIGFALGTSLYAALLVRERKNTRRALFALLDGGPYVLLFANGQPASCASLVASVDAQLRLPPPNPALNRRLLALIACTGAFIGAAVSLLVAARFG